MQSIVYILMPVGKGEGFYPGRQLCRRPRKQEVYTRAE